MPKISVIVPVYKVEKYIHQCVDSILSQSYADFELILVDDGSPDNCGTICDEYAAKDPRVVVIHRENGGAAAAKNAGLRVASGKYLSFVDSDDYLEPDAYERMVSKLEETEAEVIQCSFRNVFRTKSVPYHVQTEKTEFSAVQYLERFTKDWTCGLLWDKLYVRSLFDGIFFEEGHKIDDEYFTYQGIMNAQKIVRDDFIVCNYRKRRSGVMLSPQSAEQILRDRIDYLGKRRKNVIARFPELREVFDRHFVEAMVILFRDPAATKEIRNRIRKQLISYFREKNHTSVDVHLWPAMAEVALDLVKKKSPAGEKDPMMEQYFD